MARSLARNTRVFATHLDISGEAGGDLLSACNDQNTFEVKVLDGYSFSQDVATQDVGVNEAESNCAGSGLARGTLSFNTALNPVDVSFSTYVRPFQNSIEVDGGDTGSTADWIDCVERIFWASAMGTETSWTDVIADSTQAGITKSIISQDGDSIKFGLGASNSNSLMDLTLFFVLEQTTYKILNFNVSSAEVDFSIDGIATINWSGQGSRVLEDEAAHEAINSWVADTDYAAVPPTTTNTFLRNKLSVLELTDNEAGNFNYATLTADVTTTISGAPAAGVVTTDADLTTDDAYIGGIIYNVDVNEWAYIYDSTGVASDDVTVSSIYTTMVNAWSDTDNIKLYNATTLGITDVDTFSAFDATTGVLTLTTATATVDDYYNGGRVLNLNTGEWATIIDFETTTDTATIASSDRALVDAWTSSTDQLAFFTQDQNAGTQYCIPITGATLTLENNFTYLTPEELAIVNLPLAGFAGNRVTSGSFTAYLNTGAQGSGGLLQDMLAKIQQSVSNNYHIKFLMGGTTAPYVAFDLPHANISVPTTNVEDLITTEITFSAKPWDDTNNEASFEDTNELTVEYFA
jgi:hypothetical protein